MNNSVQRNLTRWLLPVILLAAGLAAGVGLTLALQSSGAMKVSAPPAVSQELSAQELYDAAVKDAVFADEDEIMPLVTLTKDDDRVTWNDAGNRVLLLTWHNYPESYPAGQNITLSWGMVWTFTGRELQNKYDAEKDTVTDWELRLKQLIGFPPDSEHSTVTGFWVRPEDVRRPAYQSDPTIDKMAVKFDENVDPEFKSWFDGNIIWSYFDSAYPWTRLGYTYDWADNGTEYGLSEFLVNQNAEVQAAFTESTGEFIEQLADGKATD